MKRNNIFVITLFIIWVIVAMSRTLYNFSKIYLEERNWITKSYEQKRVMQFGKKYTILMKLRELIEPESNTLFITNDLQIYFLGRYYLYPTVVFIHNEQLSIKDKNNDYDYIFIHPYNSTNITHANTIINTKIYKSIKTIQITENQISKLYSK